MTEDQIQKVFADLKNGKVLGFTSDSTNHEVVYSLEFINDVFEISWSQGKNEHASGLYGYGIKDYLEKDIFILLDKSYYGENTMQDTTQKHKQNSSAKPHRHYDMILQWAANPEGFVVELKDCYDSAWKTTVTPLWVPQYEYRLTPKKQTITKWQWLCKVKLTGKYFVHPYYSEVPPCSDLTHEVQKIEESSKEFPLDEA